MAELLQAEFAEICSRILSHPQGVQNSLQRHQGGAGEAVTGRNHTGGLPLASWGITESHSLDDGTQVALGCSHLRG